MKHKLMAMLLVCCMTLTVLPMTAFADEANAEAGVVPMKELTEAPPIEQPEGEPMMLLTAADPANEYVAKIGDKSYTTLAEAASKAQANDTITILKDQTLTEQVKFYKNLTLDGQGHKITGRLEVVDCEVTFKNVTVSYTSDNNPTVFVIGEKAQLNIETDCTIEHEGDHFAVHVANGTLITSGHIILKDSTQHAITAGGHVSKANVIVNGGTIEGPLGIWAGQRGTCVVNSGTIKSEYHAILGLSNNTDKDVVPEITIKGGELHATNTALRVYNGTATVKGGTLSGACGMEVHGDGSVGTIADGKVEAEVPVKVTTEDGKASISGGAFTHQPDPEFMAEGYTPVLNNGKYEIVTDEEAVQKVREMITGLPTADQVTLAHETAINEANAAYGNLTDAQKKLIDKALVEKLNADVAKLAELQKAAADQRTADEVIAKIDALPGRHKITLNDKEKVVNARKAYDALTTEQKELVTNYNKLVEAEQVISHLEHYLTSNITVKNSLHGWVSVNCTYAAKGDLVTITVHPDKDYKLDWLTVKDYFGNKISVTGINDVYTFVMPDTSVTVETGFKPVYQTEFRDVSYTDYYYDAVQWAVSKDITTGISNDYFAPDRTCTRAEAVTFLWRAAGSPRPWRYDNSFTDVASNDYYYDAVQWAVEEGIVKGTSDTTFSPNAVCDRGQIVTLLWRANGSRYVSNTNPFRDVNTTDYFYDAVQWAVWNDITTGMAYDTFAPNASCTRAQIVTFLYRSEK